MPNESPIIDLSVPAQKQMLVSWIKALSGEHRVSIRRVRRGRTNAQLAYLWGVVYPCVVAGLEEAWGETLTSEAVHEWCKDKFLSQPIVDRKTGEQVDTRPGSTGDLDTKGMSEYIDQIIKFAAEQLNTEIPAATQPS